MESVGEEQASAGTISNGLSPLPEDLVGDEESWDKNRTSGGLFFDVTELITEIVDSVFDLPSVEAGQLEEIQTKFDLWADGVEITSGRLDNLIGSSRELKESLSLIYFSFLSLLTDNIHTTFYHQVISPYFDQILAFVEKLVYSNQSAPEISPKELDEKVLIIENDFASRIQDGTDQFIVAFDTFQRQLSRTAPFIIDFLRDCEQKDTFTFLDDDQLEQNEGTEKDDQRDHELYEDLKPEDWYKNIILSKFPDADVVVSQIIARELWELYRNVKATLYQEVNHTVNEEPVETEKAVTIIEHDSTYESMQKSLAASLIRPPIQRVRIALSDIATELTSGSCKLTDRPLVPAPPDGVELGPGISFTCQFCLEKVTDIDNLKKWRKHILSDIRPYFCTFPDCQNNTLRYKSKTEWMAHEVEFHRLKTSWRCNLKSCGEKFTSQLALQSHLIAERNISPLWDNLSLISLLDTCRIAELDQSLSRCKICDKELLNQASSIASHIGRHLEDFALPIISQLDDRGEENSDDFSSSSSDGFVTAKDLIYSSPILDLEDYLAIPTDETQIQDAIETTNHYHLAQPTETLGLKIMISDYISKETYNWEENHSHSDFDFSRFYLVGVINEQETSYRRLTSTDSLQFHYHLQRQTASDGYDTIWLTKVPNSIPWSEVDFSEIWAGLSSMTLPYKEILHKTHDPFDTDPRYPKYCKSPEWPNISVASLKPKTTNPVGIESESWANTDTKNLFEDDSDFLSSDRGLDISSKPSQNVDPKADFQYKFPEDTSQDTHRIDVKKERYEFRRKRRPIPGTSILHLGSDLTKAKRRSMPLTRSSKACLICMLQKMRCSYDDSRKKGCSRCKKTLTGCVLDVNRPSILGFRNGGISWLPRKIDKDQQPEDSKQEESQRLSYKCFFVKCVDRNPTKVFGSRKELVLHIQEHDMLSCPFVDKFPVDSPNCSRLYYASNGIDSMKYHLKIHFPDGTPEEITTAKTYLEIFNACQPLK